MKVLTGRTGLVLHASPTCPRLTYRRRLEIDETEAVPGATRCETVECQRAFDRRERKAAA